MTAMAFSSRIGELVQELEAKLGKPQAHEGHLRWVVPRPAPRSAATILLPQGRHSTVAWVFDPHLKTPDDIRNFDLADLSKADSFLDLIRAIRQGDAS